MVLMASDALAVFETLNGSSDCPRPLRSFGRDLDLMLVGGVETVAGEHVAGLARDTHLWFLFERRRTHGWSTAGERDRACEQFSGPLPICGSCALGASSPGVPLPDIDWATRDLADRWLIVSA